jgi:hypothetical protein
MTLLATGICVAAVMLHGLSQNGVSRGSPTGSPHGSWTQEFEPLMGNETRKDQTASPSAPLKRAFVAATTGAAGQESNRRGFRQTSASFKHTEPFSKANSANRTHKAANFTPQSSQPFVADFSNSVEFTVPPSGRLPAVLLQRGGEGGMLNETQLQLADKLAVEFARDAAAREAEGTRNSAAGKTPAEADAEAFNRWRNAAIKSDSRFQLLFGSDAYNQESIRPENLTDSSH